MKPHEQPSLTPIDQLFLNPTIAASKTRRYPAKAEAPLSSRPKFQFAPTASRIQQGPSNVYLHAHEDDCLSLSIQAKGKRLGAWTLIHRRYRKKALETCYPIPVLWIQHAALIRTIHYNIYLITIVINLTIRIIVAIITEAIHHHCNHHHHPRYNQHYNLVVGH